MKKGPRRGRVIPLLIASFYIGGATGWWLHSSLSREVEPPAPAPVVLAPEEIAAAKEEAAAAPDAHIGGSQTTDTAETSGKEDDRALVWRPDPVAELNDRHLRLPIDDANVATMKGMFTERRGGGRAHEAIDILAPRNTPIHAVESGTIAKLFYSKAGGTTVYQFDPSMRFCYYYAHLERYASGLKEGQAVSAGDVLGYVGTSGNAPPGTPHLHFGIFALTQEKKWWDGRAIDPYLVFKQPG